MSFASRFNKEKKFTVDTSDYGYTSLADLYNMNGKDMIYPLLGIYINTKGIYQDAPVFATNEFFVNIPAFLIDVAREILTDEQGINDINAGKVGFQIYVYKNKRYNKDCYGVTFVDM